MLQLKILRPGGRHGIAARRVPRPDRVRRRGDEQAGPERSPRPGGTASAGRADGLHGDPRGLPHRDHRRPRVREGRPAREVRPARRERPVARRLRPHPDRGRADARRRGHRAGHRGGAPGRRGRGRRLRRPRPRARGDERDRPAAARSARGARRHRRGARGDGRHAGGRGAGQGRPGAGRRRPSPGRGRHRDRHLGDRRSAADLSPGLHRERASRCRARAHRAPTVVRRARPADDRHPGRRRPRPGRREVDGPARRRCRALRGRRAPRRLRQGRRERAGDSSSPEPSACRSRPTRPWVCVPRRSPR